MSTQLRMTDCQARAAAERMFAAGWDHGTIRRELEQAGIVRSRQTIRRWADPTAAQRKRDYDRIKARQSRHRGGRLGRAHETPEFKQSRLEGLRVAGLSLAAVAKALNFDYGDNLTRQDVRYALETGRYPRSKGKS